VGIRKKVGVSFQVAFQLEKNPKGRALA